MSYSKGLALSLFLCLCVGSVQAQSGVLQNMKGADIDFSSQLQKSKALKLDDPFLVQLFARWKALGALKPETNELFDLIFAGENKAALLSLQKLSDQKISSLRTPIEMYLLYQEGHYQSALSLWPDLSSETNFLSTELGLAFDQFAGPGLTLLVSNTGYNVSSEVARKLQMIEGRESIVNYTLQAYKALRSGKDALKWIGKLPENTELRVLLAQSAILSYARDGQLGASGKLISQVIEPWMQDESDLEKVALHYLTLARLLYQARAFDQAEHYYYLIPESSRYFVEARTEVLWSQLQRRDFSNAHGQLATLRLPVFESSYHPEIFLVQAIGNTMLCEFVDAQQAISRFVSVNRSWAKKISENLASENPQIVYENDYVGLLKRQLASVKREREILKALKLTGHEAKLAQIESEAADALKELARGQWENRKKILEDAIYKMKFVRVELLSRMRAVKEGLASNIAGGDQVSRYQAATAKSNQIVFPSDGMLWGDELFNMSAQVKNLCIEGKL